MNMTEKFKEQLNNLELQMNEWLVNEMKKRNLTEINNINEMTDGDVTLYIDDIEGMPTIPCKLDRIVIDGNIVEIYGYCAVHDETYRIEYINIDDLYYICDEMEFLFDEYDKGIVDFK